jgi:hypothetical protein
MWDEEMHKGAAIVGVLIIVIVGIIVAPSYWKAPDQIVQNSGNSQLQTSYQAGKQMIEQAGNLQDGSDVANSVRNFGK